MRPILLGAFTPALLLSLGLAPLGAQALGLGRPVVQSALGKPLDLSVPLTLAEGEPLPDSCLRAEVSAGDARVPAGLLQLRVEGEPGQRRIRVQSVVRIEEPALRVTLAIGCPVRLTREFSLLVDPAAADVAPTPPPAPAVVAPEPRARLVVEAPRPAPAPLPVSPPRQKPRSKPRAEGPRLVLERPEVPVAQAPQRQAATRAAEGEMTPELEAQITQLEQTVAQLKAELQARQAAQSALPAPAPASAPVLAAASAPDATSAVIASPAASTADAIPRRAQATSAPTSALAPAPSVRAAAYRDPLTWLMTLGLGLVAGSAAFYGSRWLDQRARRDNAYWRALQATAEGAAPPTPPADAAGASAIGQDGPAPPTEDGPHTITRPQPRPLAVPPSAIAPTEVPGVQVMPDGALQSTLATQPLPVQAAPVLVQELTVADELLDLQQQTDFLLLLGQHEAAADLLATHLQRGTASAMPYLMLMELCQQRGEPEVFAELVRQFEKRFGVMAPGWSQSLARGRSLDACPSVIAHLQVVWPDPAAAMQMVQQLLAQGSGPGTASFDLPAYRDLLALYGVSRDLFESGMRSDEVDLMLPLDSSFGDAPASTRY